MYIQSDRLTSLSQSTATRHNAPSSVQSTALGIYAGRVLKACCASYAQRACSACFMPSNETISSLGYVSLISGFRDNTFAPDPWWRDTQNRWASESSLYALWGTLWCSPRHQKHGVSIQMCIICSVWHIQMLVDFLIYNVTHHIILKDATAHQVVVYITHSVICNALIIKYMGCGWWGNLPTIAVLFCWYTVIYGKW